MLTRSLRDVYVYLNSIILYLINWKPGIKPNKMSRDNISNYLNLH